MNRDKPDVLERRFINRFQGGFPIVERPYSVVATKIGTTEAVLIQTIESLLDRRLLSRFGPLYDAVRLGGSVILAAMQVDEEQFDTIADKINALDAVAHNYKRDHEFNMWFVVSTERAEEVETVITTIEKETGHKVYAFPKLREFYLGLWLQLNGDGSIETVPITLPPASGSHAIDALDRRLIRATQRGLPLHPDPWGEIAKMLDIDRTEVMQRMRTLLDTGIIRRIGAIPNHYRLGLKCNAMTVWDVPDVMTAEIGTQVAALPFVSHCYERPRFEGKWPYNLFAMVHGSDRSSVDAKIEHISTLLEGRCHSHDTLFSTAILKKTGLRLAG
jgi:DNA-binding Lrp family transcriptional regulator